MTKNVLFHDLERVAREKARSRSLLTAALTTMIVWFVVWVFPMAHPRILGPRVAHAEFVLESVLLVILLALAGGYFSHSGNPIIPMRKKQFALLGLREVQQSDPDLPQKVGKGKEKEKQTPPTLAPSIERNYNYGYSSSPRSPTGTPRRGGGGVVNRHSNSHEKSQFAFSELSRTISGSSPMYDSSYASSSSQMQMQASYVNNNNNQPIFSYQNSPKESEHHHHLLSGGRKLKIYDAIKYLGLEKAQESGYLSSWVESLRRVLLKHAQDTLQELEVSSHKIVNELSKRLALQQPQLAFSAEEQKSMRNLLLYKIGSAQLFGRECQLADLFKHLRYMFGGDQKVFPQNKEVLEEIENCASLLELFCPLGTLGSQRLASVNLDIATALRELLPDVNKSSFFSAVTGSRGGNRRHANYSQDELYLAVFLHLCDRASSLSSSDQHKFSRHHYSPSHEDLVRLVRSEMIVRTGIVRSMEQFDRSEDRFEVFVIAENGSPCILQVEESGFQNLLQSVFCFCIQVFHDEGTGTPTDSAAVIKILGEIFKIRGDKSFIREHINHALDADN